VSLFTGLDYRTAKCQVMGRKDLTSCSVAAIFMKFLVNMAHVHSVYVWVGVAQPLT